MATLDSLPGDQRAVLTLVLGRGRGYAEIAGVLAIDPDAVRARAHAALDALGPATEVPASERARIADYLLGQLSASDAAAVHGRLADSPPARTWARAVRDELTPLASGALPEVASEPAPPPLPAPLVPPAPLAPPAPPALVTSSPPVAPSSTAPDTASATPPDAPRRSSRLGGAIVIVVTAIVIAAVVVIVFRHHHHASPTAGGVTTTNPASSSTTTSPATSTTAASRPSAQINLDPTTAGSAAKAVAFVFKDGSQREIAIIGQHIPPNTTHNSYEVWLYNSESSATKVGFVNPGVGSDGKLSTGGLLPSDAGQYRELIVTTETAADPTHPGPILLAGQITGL